ncbi:MAG: DHA2 family efflux MFS transporter permease subunit [Gammaproteobacteria bacterium]
MSETVANAVPEPADSKSMPAAAVENKDHVSLATWLTVFGSVIGAFIAVLNIMITNASLKDIQGALGATLEEGSFISTAYLTAEVVVIPLTGWFAMVFGLRRFMLSASTMFIGATLLCALAWNLESMLVFRALAGLAGGTFIPLSFAVILTLLPPSKQPIGIAIFSLTATQAPAIGPALGGYLTETFGWQSIFYLQIIPTSIMFTILWWGLARSQSKLQLLKNGDWLGIASLSIALGAMIITLEEGNRKDWFESEFIQRGAAIALVFFVIFLYRQLRGTNPFINVRLLKRWNFGLANIIGVILGLGLYGSVFITPLYLAQVQGYNAWQTGVTMMWFGFPQLIMVPLIVRLMKAVDLRHLVAIGCAIFAWSLLININMSADSAYDQLRLANFIRGIGQPFLSVPLAVIATVGIEQAQVGSASGLYNLTRNLGGSIGIAFLASFLTLREHFHSNHVVENISLYSHATVERLEALQGYFIALGADPVLAGERALRVIDATARRESLVLAYNDCFYFMGAAFVIGMVLTYMLKSYRTPTAPAK